MDFPLLTMNGGGSLSDERAQKKMKKKRKREEREAALLRDVIAASESLLDTPSPQKSLSSQDSSEPSKSIHSKCIAADPRSTSPVLDPRVPLKLYISNLAPRVRKCHIEAWCLGQQEEEEDGETRGGGHRDEGGGGDGGSSTLSSCLTVHDMVEVVLVAEDRTNPTGRHKGFGFVELANHEAAAAVLALDGSELMGQAVSVRPAREKGGKGKGGKGEGRGGGRRFGSLDYTALAEGVQKRHKQLVAEQVARNEASRKVFLADQVKKAEEERAFVAQGGVLPGGLGHGFNRGTGAPKLHSGFRDFEL